MKKLPDWNNFWRDVSIIREFFKAYTQIRMKSYIRLLKQFDTQGKTALELGGGSGYLSKILSRRMHTVPYVIDNNRGAYELSRKINGKEVRYLFEDMFSHRQKYDIVFSDGLVEHFYPSKRKGVFALHKRLMKKGGLCIVFVPKKSWFVENILTLRNEYEYKFTERQLRREAASVGLKVLNSVSDFHMVGVLCS